MGGGGVRGGTGGTPFIPGGAGRSRYVGFFHVYNRGSVFVSIRSNQRRPVVRI